MYVRNFETSNTWIPGEITDLSGPVSSIVNCGDKMLIRRHQDHLRHRRDAQELDRSGDTSDDVCIDVRANEETAENGETVTENAADTQPALATQSAPTVEATPEPSTKK